MAESPSSISSKDVSSTVSLYNLSGTEGGTTQSNIDNASMRALYENDLNDDIQDQQYVISRPLSRSSVTSGLSMTATKDGVEGRRVQRYGIPQYSLNLLNSMAQSHRKKHLHSQQRYLDEVNSDEGTSSYQDFPSAPPMTLKDKMKLLNGDRLLPQLNSGSTDSLNEDSIERPNLEALLDVSSTHGESKLTHFSLHSHPAYGHANGHNNNSELDSNLSTIGDDVSYLRDTRSLPPPSMAVDSDHD